MQHKYGESRLPIKAWAEDDRPREKLLEKGRQALSDAELIAIIIGSGNWTESAVELSKRIMQQTGNNLAALAKMSVPELMQFRGIGQAKAIAITAALELGRRRMDLDLAENRNKIGGSIDVVKMMRPQLVDLNHEEFWVLLLNRANVLLRKELMSKGGTAGTIVDAKLIFKAAMHNGATAIVLVHNHPSGTARPSDQDRALTRRLRQGAGLLDLEIVDHVIITETEYYSFADDGQL